MAAMFTRTVKLNRATALKLAMEEGKPVAQVIAECEYNAATDSENEARKALKANGFKVPRGCLVNVETIREDVYACTVEEFMAIAHIIER